MAAAQLGRAVRVRDADRRAGLQQQSDVLGDHVGPLPAVGLRALRASAAAYATVSPDAAEVPNPLPQGPMPAWLAAGAAALDAGVHAWDIAVATGRPSGLDDDLAAELLPVARALVEPLRAYGVYATALEPGDHDSASAELLRYLGRDPNWSASS